MGNYSKQQERQKEENSIIEMKLYRRMIFEEIF